jgi:hypothetical protein
VMDIARGYNVRHKHDFEAGGVTWGHLGRNA